MFLYSLCSLNPIHHAVTFSVALIYRTLKLFPRTIAAAALCFMAFFDFFSSFFLFSNLGLIPYNSFRKMFDGVTYARRITQMHRPIAWNNARNEFWLASTNLWIMCIQHIIICTDWMTHYIVVTLLLLQSPIIRFQWK